MAAVLAAKFASNLGVYGTILGAGVVSAVATCSGSLFQHFFRRTGEQIRDVTVSRRPRVRRTPVLVTSGGHPVPETFRPTRSGAGREPSGARASRPTAWGVATTTWGVGRPARGSAVDPHAPGDTATRLLRRYQVGQRETQVLPGDGHAARPLADGTGNDIEAGATRLLGRGGASGASGASGHPVAGLDAATRLLHRARPVPGEGREPEHTAVLRNPGDPGDPCDPGDLGVPGGPGTVDPDGGPPPDAFTEGTVHRARVRGLKRPLLASGMVFVVAMGGITTYELASGHSLNGDRMRTTIGDVLSGGESGSGHAPATPVVTPSGQSSQGPEGTDHEPSSADPRDSQAPDQQSSPTPTPSGTQGSGTASTPGTGADSGGGQGAGSDGGTGGHRQTATPTPTPTATQSDGSGGGAGAGSGTGGSATRQPDGTSGQ